MGSTSAIACSVTACRGVDKGGNIPNLGYVDADSIAKLEDAVFSKEFAPLGMPDFTGKLEQEDLEKIKAFIQGTADAVRPKLDFSRDPRASPA